MILMPDRSMRIAPILAIAGLFLFSLAFNFAKPFHIDDTAHLAIARWIAENPLRPMSGMLNWGDFNEPIHRTNQPHLYFYLMAAWAGLFGWSEHSMHALQSLFVGGALCGLYRLAHQFISDRAVLATAMVALSPAFVIGQNSMVDLPLLCLWVWFFSALVEFRRTKSIVVIWLAAILCALAMLIKYNSVVLYPIMCLVVWLVHGRSGWAALVLPVLSLAAWSSFNLLDYGGIHIRDRPTPGSLSSGAIVEQALNWILVLGAIAPTSLLIPSVLPRAAWLRICGGALFVAMLVGSTWACSHAFTYDSSRAFKIIFLLAGGMLVGVATVSIGGRLLVRHVDAVEDFILLCWIAAIGAFTVALAPHVGTRHVLLALPPVVILVLRQLPSRLSARTGWWAATVALAIATPLAAADVWWAGLYKRYAAEIRDGLPRQATVWTAGHLGWQWYAAQQGMRVVAADEAAIRPGDYLVYPDRIIRQRLPEGLNLSAVNRIEIQRSCCIERLAGIGPYYSDLWHLPWQVHRDPVEVFLVFRVAAAPRQ